MSSSLCVLSQWFEFPFFVLFVVRCSVDEFGLLLGGDEVLYDEQPGKGATKQGDGDHDDDDDDDDDGGRGEDNDAD